MPKWIATYKTPDGWIVTKTIEADTLEDAVWLACDLFRDFLYIFISDNLSVRPAQKKEKTN